MKSLNQTLLRLVNEHLLTSLSGILSGKVADLETSCLIDYGIGILVRQVQLPKGTDFSMISEEQIVCTES